MLTGALFAWCLLAAWSAAGEAAARPRSPVPDLEIEFTAFVPHLPATGDIGYLEPYVDGGALAAVRRMQVAQYALIPRVVLTRVAGRYAIVPSGHENPAGDERLARYVRTVTLPSGDRLFRRFP